MKCENIIGILEVAIQKVIIETYMHEGYVGGTSSNHINFEIDGKEYVLTLQEVKNGEHWSEK